MHCGARARRQGGRCVDQIAGDDRPAGAWRIDSPGETGRQRVGKAHPASIAGADVAQRHVKADVIASRDRPDGVSNFLYLDVGAVHGN